MRQDGFYWVKYLKTWRPAYYWRDGTWEVCGYSDMKSSSDFEEIDERQIKRDESKNA